VTIKFRNACSDRKVVCIPDFIRNVLENLNIKFTCDLVGDARTCRNKDQSVSSEETALIKKKIKFSYYIRKLEWSSCKVIYD